MSTLVHVNPDGMLKSPVFSQGIIDSGRQHGS